MKRLIAKKYFVMLLLTAINILNGCSKKDTPVPTPANPYGGENGQVTFWCSNVNTSVFPVTISVNGTYVGTIGGMVTTTPDCNNANDKVVKYVAAPGTYNVYATTANGGNWSGSFTISKGSCFLEQLQ